MLELYLFINDVRTFFANWIIVALLKEHFLNFLCYSLSLDQRLAKPFSKDLDGKYFMFCQPQVSLSLPFHPFKKIIP
jgi:hypothetical protein